MIDLELQQGNWDLVLRAGDLAVLDGHAQTTQHIRQRILAFQGEWFLDLSEGLPWLQDILGKPQDVVLVEALLKERIQGSPEVEALTAFELTGADAERTLRIDFTVRLAGGRIIDLQTEIGQ